MRYKFRGKETDTGKWVYGYYFKDFNGKSYIINTLQEIQNADTSNVWIEVLGETVGQYTGLKDKNGKEIFEGDIVYIIPEDETGVIEWDNERVRYIVIYDNIITDFDNWYGKDLEVIGNIYDNPELLEKGE